MTMAMKGPTARKIPQREDPRLQGFRLARVASHPGAPGERSRAQRGVIAIKVAHSMRNLGGTTDAFNGFRPLF